MLKQEGIMRQPAEIHILLPTTQVVGLLNIILGFSIKFLKTQRGFQFVALKVIHSLYLAQL